MFSTLQKRTFIKSLFVWMYHQIKRILIPLLLVLYVLIKILFFESAIFWEPFEITPSNKICWDSDIKRFHLADLSACRCTNHFLKNLRWWNFKIVPAFKKMCMYEVFKRCIVIIWKRNANKTIKKKDGVLKKILRFIREQA